jgi:hypothetical protein
VRGIVRREVLPHLDCPHKAIALAVQRAQEARRASPLPQRLAKGLNTRCQRLVSDKLVGPQLHEEFLLGDHPVAMRHEVDEHLKDFAPELDGLPNVMQLMALGVKRIVAKDVAHRTPLAPSEPSVPRHPVGSRFPRLSHATLSGWTGAYHITIDSQKYPEKSPKLPRTCHVFPLAETYVSALHLAGDAARHVRGVCQVF